MRELVEQTGIIYLFTDIYKNRWRVWYESYENGKKDWYCESEDRKIAFRAANKKAAVKLLKEYLTKNKIYGETNAEKLSMAR